MTLGFGNETARRLERFYAGRDVVRRRSLVLDALAAQPGERVLDVGCGPGFYVAELAAAGVAVTGIDGSEAMLAVARERAGEQVPLLQGDAGALPFGDGSFDAAFSVQVMEYVPDVVAALREIRRVLAPGGRVVVWDFDWASVSWRSADEARMARALAAWDEHLVHPALPRALAGHLRAAGFDDVRAQGHAFVSLEADHQTFGGIAIDLITGFVGARELMPAEELAAWAAEQRELSQAGEFYFACTQVCFTAQRR